MADGYRITIRTDRETADVFREWADYEDVTLGQMLSDLVDAWYEKYGPDSTRTDFDAAELGRLYST